VKHHFKSYQSLSLHNISDSPYNRLVFRRWKPLSNSKHDYLQKQIIGTSPALARYEALSL
jgi:hypothetical protein